MEKVLIAVFVLQLAAVLKSMPIHEDKARNATRIGATYGVDVSQLVGVDAFKCLKGNGYSFAIVRAYQSLCTPDGNAIHTIANAQAAGIKYVDVYMFPSPKCSRSASEQVQSMVSSLSGISYGQIWLDIEGSQYWHSSYGDNQDFFNELLSAAKSSGKTVGVYSSKYQWEDIMGYTFTGGSGQQLWYAHYDNDPSFSDFESFGGWSRPTIKQYVGDATLCGAGIDKNFY